MWFWRTTECRLRSCPIGLSDGVWMNSLNRQCVVSHLVFQVPSAHALLVFPWASLVSCLACPEEGWRDCSRFRPAVLVVTVSTHNSYGCSVHRGRNMPKLPLVRRISDMLQTTCPPTCPLVQVLVHFVGPKLDALDRQNSGQCKEWHGSHWHRHSFVVISCLKCLNWIFSTQVTCWSLRNYLQYNLVMDR